MIDENHSLADAWIRFHHLTKESSTRAGLWWAADNTDMDGPHARVRGTCKSFTSVQRS